MQPDDLFSVRLKMRDWVLVQQILGEQKYTLVAAVIGQIQEQFSLAEKPPEMLPRPTIVS